MTRLCVHVMGELVASGTAETLSRLELYPEDTRPAPAQSLGNQGMRTMWEVCRRRGSISVPVPPPGPCPGPLTLFVIYAGKNPPEKK